MKEKVLLSPSLAIDSLERISNMAPPFLDVDGLCNLRDCGGYPIAGQPDKVLRRGILFRSADPSSLTATGIAQLQALAISRVFDLRCDSEIRDSTAKGFGAIQEWHPAQRVSLPVFTDAQYAIADHRTLRDQKLRSEGDKVSYRCCPYHTLLY